VIAVAPWAADLSATSYDKVHARPSRSPGSTTVMGGGLRLTGVRRVHATVAVIALAGLAIRLAVAWRPLASIDRLFIPDDSYYTLSIARSLAHGHGPTVGHAPLTSGFQPLLAFLEAPIFWFIHSPDGGLRAALVLLALCDALTAVWLARIAYRIGWTSAAVIAAGVWALSPFAVANAMGGLETALSTMLAIALVDAWMTVHRRPSTTGWVLCGMVAGLAVLARIDSLLLLALLVGAECLGRRSWCHLRHLVPTAAGTALMLGPWWIYSLLTFGSPVPASGNAVRRLVQLHQLGVRSELAWAAGTVLGAPFTLLTSFRHTLFAHPTVGAALFLGIAAVGAATALLVACGWSAGNDRRFAACLPLFAVGLLGFYSLYLGAIWFDTRYLAPVAAATTLLLAIVGTALWRRDARVARTAVCLLVGGLVVAVALPSDVHYLVATPAGTVDTGYDGAKGYRELAPGVLAAAPSGSVIGSLQSGALGYYNDGRVKVVNLDGVVNSGAARALQNRRLGEYARSQGVQYFADWPYNLGVFITVSSDSRLTPHSFHAVYAAAPQGADIFTLWRIDWTRSGALPQPPG